VLRLTRVPVYYGTMSQSVRRGSATSSPPPSAGAWLRRGTSRGRAAAAPVRSAARLPDPLLASPLVNDNYNGYQVYQQRAGQRIIPVVLLEPA
jgi:hypothetical protein